MTTVLFVCTGNTCRSPMAECLFNALCNRHGNSQLHAISAGIFTEDGLPASAGSIRAMAARGLSLEKHCSSMIDPSLLSQADLIVGMSKGHIDTIKKLYPDIQTELRYFDPEISDPYQGSDALYEYTAKQMEPQIAALFHLLSAKA